MQITDVGLNSRDKLVDFLSIGFPQRSTNEWGKFFNRLNDTLNDKGLPDCAPGQGPRIGWLLGNVDSPDGILLGLPNPLGGLTEDKQPRQVNMSSWFVKEERRAQAIWMLRKISNLPGHTFTDLTPSVAVARMLPSLGYTTISSGMLRLYTPQAMLTPRDHWQVITANETIDRQIDPAIAQALKDHITLGCIVTGLVNNGHCMPVVLQRRVRHKFVKAAEVIYLPAPNDQIRRPKHAIPALARWLALRGVLLLEIEKPVDDQPAIPMTQRLVADRPRFVRGPYDAGGINHLYSELAYV